MEMYKLCCRRVPSSTFGVCFVCAYDLCWVWKEDFCLLNSLADKEISRREMEGSCGQ